MLARSRILASLAVGAVEGVEYGANGTPSAFRIWKAGANVTDYGVHVFSERSAQALMAEQSTRGNLYSIDVDHMSLNTESPPESRKAVGWARLGVRASDAGPELWAEGLEWTPAVAAGLASRPPEWRYFSPAYDVEKKSGEIVSFLNIALTNNPATHHVTQLATQRIAASKGTTMKMSYEEAVAAMMGDDEEKKEAAKKCIAAWAKAAKDAEEPPPEASRANRAGIPSGDPVAELLAKVGESDRQIAELVAVNASRDLAEMIAARPDLSESQRKYLAGRPVAEVKQLLASPLLAPPAEDAGGARATASTVQAMRGSTQHSAGEIRGAVRASRSQQATEIAERFGRATKPKEIHWDGNELVLERITRQQARELLAARGVPLPTLTPSLASASSLSPGITDVRREIMASAARAEGRPLPMQSEGA